jgi:hypothetical protein
MLEISGTGAATEERIVAIEKKMRDMEALVKGLTQELLDLKSIAMKMSKQTEERSRQELKRVLAVAQEAQPQPATTGAASGSSSTVVMRKGARPSDAPATPPEPSMDMIMQSDGTMKLEITLLHRQDTGGIRRERPSRVSRAILSMPLRKPRRILQRSKEPDLCISQNWR